jgi:predicted DNA-binding transcriptional regulator AlpA
VLSDITYNVKKFSTREAARKLGKSLMTVQRHIKAKTLPVPPLIKMGSTSVRLWTARDIEKARKVLAGIRPGRKKKA